MRFQLPKPLHGWREFAGEVGIIVIGVLIALAAQQLAETIHWQRVASAGRASVGEEMEAQFFAASEMAIAKPCIDRQLQLLEAAVLAPGPYRPVPSYSEGPLTYSLRAPSRSWSDHIWESVSSDGTAAHFDRKTRLGLAAFYGLVDYLREHNSEADSLRLRLAALSHPIQPDAATRAGIVADIEQARGIYEIMSLVSNQLVGQGEAIGFRPQASSLRADDSGTLEFCRAHHLPLGEVRPVKP